MHRSRFLHALVPTWAGVATPAVLLHACREDRPTTPPETSTAVVGKWSGVLPAPIVQVHLHLLPNGQVLSWGASGDPQVWSPATGGFTTVPAPSWLFCAGHDFLPDGRLFVAGGHISAPHRLAGGKGFGPPTAAWQAAPGLTKG